MTRIEVFLDHGEQPITTHRQPAGLADMPTYRSEPAATQCEKSCDSS